MRVWCGRILRAAGGLAVAALMFFAPRTLPEYVARDEYKEFFELKQSEWEGILTIWNIYTEAERLPQSVIDKAKKRFCGKNIGIYIEYATLTPSQAKKKTANGEKPDLLLFPESAKITGKAELEFSIAPPETQAVRSGFEFDVDEREKARAAVVFRVWVNEADAVRAKYSKDFASVIAKTAVDVLK